MLRTLIFFTLTCAVLADLRCYDCDPDSPGKCVEPVKNNIQQISCEQKFSLGVGKSNFFTQVRGLPFGGTAHYDCVALYFKKWENSSIPEGVYRDCVRRSDEELNIEPCDIAKSKIQDGTVTKCVSCDEDGCNKMAVGSAATFAISILFTLLAASVALIL